MGPEVKIALVGVSGAGKRTLLAKLCDVDPSEVVGTRAFETTRSGLLLHVLAATDLAQTSLHDLKLRSPDAEAIACSDVIVFLVDGREQRRAANSTEFAKLRLILECAQTSPPVVAVWSHATEHDVPMLEKAWKGANPLVDDLLSASSIDRLLDHIAELVADRDAQSQVAPVPLKRNWAETADLLFEERAATKRLLAQYENGAFACTLETRLQLVEELRDHSRQLDERLNEMSTRASVSTRTIERETTRGVVVFVSVIVSVVVCVAVDVFFTVTPPEFFLFMVAVLIASAWVGGSNKLQSSLTKALKLGEPTKPSDVGSQQAKDP